MVRVTTFSGVPAHHLYLSSGLELINAQSPESMKGLLTGIFFLVFGLCSGAAIFVSYQTQEAQLHCYIYYLMFLVVALLGLLAYCTVVLLYTNRQRPNEEHDEHLHLLRTGQFAS